MGLPRGKTEAWYVLSAAPDAKVGLGLSRRLTPQQLREPSTMARSLISLSGTPCRQTTSFSCLQERFTRLAQVSSSRNSSSGATRHSACSILVGGVNFKSKTPLRWRTLDRPIFKCGPNSLPRNEGCLFPARISYSNGSIWPRTRPGVWMPIEKPGFSFSAAVLLPDRWTLSRATLFLRKRIASICRPATSAWWASWHTPATARSELAAASHTGWPINAGPLPRAPVPASLAQAKALPKNGRLETIK